MFSSADDKDFEKTIEAEDISLIYEDLIDELDQEDAHYDANILTVY